jgi:hypothetical protein
MNTNTINESIIEVDMKLIRPAPINDVIYQPLDPRDPSLDQLVELIEREGLLEPIVLSLDNVILSGHRRYAAARRLEWETIRARRHPISSWDDEFKSVLVMFNSQREKDASMRIREGIALANPEDCYEDLLEEREETSKISTEPLILKDKKPRKKITKNQMPLLEAVKKILEDLREYWPLSVRRIHYSLLNDPPLTMASKPKSIYRNNERCYKKLCQFLTEARAEGLLPKYGIGDKTREENLWASYPNVGPFFQKLVNQFGKGYVRDKMQSQPNHIEIVGEKLTIENIITPIAAKYGIPCMISRGYCSYPPRMHMYDRWKASGKNKLVIIFMNDLDPEGLNMPEAFIQAMRGDFKMGNRVQGHRAGLKIEHVRELKLPRNNAAKVSSSRYKEFSKKYGQSAYELEACPPDRLQEILDETIRSIINLGLYNEQVELEKTDAVQIRSYSQEVKNYLETLDF